MTDPVFEPTADDIDQAHDVLDTHEHDPHACPTCRAGRRCLRRAVARGLVVIDAALTDS